MNTEQPARLTLPDASLAGAPVVAVLSSVARDHLVGPVVSLQGEVHLQHVGAGLDQAEDPVALRHLLVPGRPRVLHVVVNQPVLHQHAATEKYIGKYWIFQCL